MHLDGSGLGSSPSTCKKPKDEKHEGASFLFNTVCEPEQTLIGRLLSDNHEAALVFVAVSDAAGVCLLVEQTDSLALTNAG